MRDNRSLLDPLYGDIIPQPDIWRLLATPEMQRLREVRLCNINSPTMPGAASVSRFEHSIGTSHLASVCSDAWPGGISASSRSGLEIAALLHDVGTTGFGHSVEYVLQPDGFRHDDFTGIVGALNGPPHERDSDFFYRQNSLEPIYFGERPKVSRLLGPSRQRQVDDLIKGTSRLGRLISGSVDLDNIDNVYRLSYHMGLSREVNAPVALAAALHIDQDGQLVVRSDSRELLHDWQSTRARLYERLLTNADDFAAKCMLERALLHAKREHPEAVRWNYVDYHLAEQLNSIGGQARDTVRRLMLGDLYYCVGMFELLDVDRVDGLLASGPDPLRPLEKQLGVALSRQQPRGGRLDVAIHLIRDVNRTWRPIQCIDSVGKPVSLPAESRRFLVGIFLTNSEYGSTTQNDVGQTSHPDENLANVARATLQRALGASMDRITNAIEPARDRGQPQLWEDSIGKVGRALR